MMPEMTALHHKTDNVKTSCAKLVGNVTVVHLIYFKTSSGNLISDINMSLEIFLFDRNSPCMD